MKRGKHRVETKKLAEKLRSERKSYKEIVEITGVPKSTLSDWLGVKYARIFDRKAQLKHLSKIRRLAMVAIKEKKERRISAIKEKVAREIKDYPLKNISFKKSLLAMLYWAEGTKSLESASLVIVNTDPKLLSLFITLLRECFNIDESKLKIRLHIHYYHKVKVVRKYWSKILNVPEKNFNGTHVKKRSVKKRFRKNFIGICFLQYGSDDVRRELIEIGKQIQERVYYEKMSS